MSADLPAKEHIDNDHDHRSAAVDSAINKPDNDVGGLDDRPRKGGATSADVEHGEVEEEEEEEDDEPKLKYAKLTGNLANVYRNGDSTSNFLVAGDKMIVGTHAGSIHVLSLPDLKSLRTYRAHQASVTSISISPIPTVPKLIRSTDGKNVVLQQVSQGKTNTSPESSRNNGNLDPRSARPRQQPILVPNTPSNNIYIATSSMDGHVCVQSLTAPEDVQLRNFARPVNAVALSPDYKNDRTYLSGGLAGNLVVTTGGKSGVSADANTNSAAAAASGWLGAIGLGSNTGRDQILHSGEGTIHTIKWSSTGRWVAWVNEEGIKIMRSHLKLGSEESEDAWRRIAHAQRPNQREWEEMASVWKARCEWIEDKNLELENPLDSGSKGTEKVEGSPAKKKKFERLVVGWGDWAYVLHVYASNITTSAGRRQVGSADVMHKLHFVDCIVSGISFYTPSLLAVLAYRTRDDDDKPIVHNNSTKSERRGRQYRHTGLAPQLRLVNVVNGEEVDLDELSNISRSETLASQDYHLGTVFFQPSIPVSESSGKIQSQRGTFEGIWDAASGVYVTKMFSSGASVRSNGSSGGGGSRNGSWASPRPSALDVTASPDPGRRQPDAHAYALESGLKLFIVSPYDCVLAVKRQISDHLTWLLDHQKYADAWNLIDEHPEAVDTVSLSAGMSSSPSGLSSPARSLAGEVMGAQNGDSLADFFADNSSSHSARKGVDGARSSSSRAESEKRRVGQLWLTELISRGDWAQAGKVAAKVLGNSGRWEHWVFTFAQASKFDEITPYIPSTQDGQTPLSGQVYEVVLGHYIYTDPKRLTNLLEQWDPELFDVRTVVAAVEERLASGEVKEDGDDWRVLLESLAKLYSAGGRASDALRCYIRLQDADKAFALIRDEKLADTVSQDIPGLIMLRVTHQQLRASTTRISDLEEASAEAIQLLAEETYRGTLDVDVVVKQLQSRGDYFQPFLYLYLRALWDGVGDVLTTGYSNGNTTSGRAMRRRGGLGSRNYFSNIDLGHQLVETHPDLAVRLFAEYDRSLLLVFLKNSEKYNYERAAEICELRHYIPELVHLLSKTGQNQRALRLIIGELSDVGQAIDFVKQTRDRELWSDLLEYSMNRPALIKGLLEEIGAVGLLEGEGGEDGFSPIEVVRRIPEGVEIEGLKSGLWKLVREFEIQMSISEGVARVLRGEVATEMDVLRAGRRKAVCFEVLHEQARPTDIEIEVRPVPLLLSEQEEISVGNLITSERNSGMSSTSLPNLKPPPDSKLQHRYRPGSCASCTSVFHENEKEFLLGFACGHVYHLSCLIDANPQTRDSEAAKDLLVQLEESDDGDAAQGTWAGARSVGAKVAHAHVIRNVLGSVGCLACESDAQDG